MENEYIHTHEGWRSMVGDMLRAERERRNLTVADVERETSIRGYYIESIEQGNLDALPGMAYAKGFIRKYATFLGLDADAMIQSFLAEREGARVEEEAIKAQPRKLEKVVPVREKPVSIDEVERKQSAGGTLTVNRYDKKGGGTNWRSVLLASLVVLIVGGAGALYFGTGNTIDVHILPETASQSETKKDVGAQADPSMAPEKAEEKSDTPKAQESFKADGVELKLDFTDRCWTEVSVDGKTVYEGTAEKGKSMTFKGKESVHVLAGNAGAMQIALNGKSIGAAGNIGQVVDKAFTPMGETVQQSVKEAQTKTDSTRVRR